jgi:imidazolonepropionase-like amidohydrolase
MKYLILIVTDLQIVNAQPAPAPAQKEKIAITGGTLHVGNGSVIENACIVFDKGKILYAGSDLQKAEGVKNKIDAGGHHVYPGFIGPSNNLGLAEIEQVKATIDYRELGNFNPNVRSLTSYNTDSKIIPTVRSNGMLMTQVIPNGGVISGQSSIMQLDAWNWEDAVIKSDEGIFLNWPSPYQFRGWWAEQEKGSANEKYQNEVDEIVKYFDEAFAYSKKEYTVEKHLGFEAMRGVWNGEKKLYIRTNLAKAIIQAVQFAKKYNVKPVIVGAADAVRVLDFLKTNDIAVILSPPHSLPVREDDDIDQPFKNAKILQDSGILFCLSVNGFWEQRNLAFQAGQAIAYGLSYEDAIAAISLNTAKIMNIEKRVGSVETGKDATFFISTGDALDMRSNNVVRAFIQGRDIDLDDKQKELFRRFWHKYHPK